MAQIADGGSTIIGTFFQNFNYIRHLSSALQTLTSFGLTDTVFWGAVGSETSFSLF